MPSVNALFIAAQYYSLIDRAVSQVEIGKNKRAIHELPMQSGATITGYLIFEIEME